MTAHYRKDIDGLRSLAILPVIFFHAHLGFFKGGYVGVDIFFVISGYLITGILARECELGRFSLLNFYDRRVRRIFPALFLVFALTTLVSMFVMLPSEFARYGQSLLGACLFASNIVFWKQTNYFDDPSLDNPLLHTWSLSVEEQFYVLWPLVLWAGLRYFRGRWFSLLLIVLTIASLLLAEWLTTKSPRTAFYMFPARAWELGLGAILALNIVPAARSRLSNEVFAVTGLFLIAFAVLFYDANTRFPGLSALLPCLGTAMIIYAGIHHQQNVVARLLSTRPLVFIGLLSYSLYLWHWPIFSLFELHFGSPTVGGRLGLIAATFVCAFASWRFVEKPFRVGASGVSQARFRVSAAVAVAAVFGATGYMVTANRGLPFRLPAQAVSADVQSTRPSTSYLGCNAGKDYQPVDIVRDCVFSQPPKSRQQALVWGDSHAGPFYDALKTEFRASNLEVRRATRSACVPLVGALQVDPAGDGDEPCLEFNEMFVRMVEQTPDIQLILVTGRWGRMSGRKLGVAEYRYLVDENDRELSPEVTQRAFDSALEKTLQRLSKHGAEIILIGPNPEFPVEVPKCVARAYWREEGPEQCTHPYDSTLTEVGWVEPLLVRVAAKFSNVTYVSAITPLCSNASTCDVLLKGTDRLLYFDTNHLRLEGALLVLQQPQVKALAQRFSAITSTEAKTNTAQHMPLNR